MQPHLENIRFFNRGYCWQSEYFTGQPRIRPRRFQAVVVAFEHPQHGKCQIDAGYGSQVLTATRHWPQRALRWVTPLPTRRWPLHVAASATQVSTPEHCSADRNKPSAANACGQDQTTLDYLFISHFHIDHIGGLSDFRTRKVVYRQETWSQLQRLSPWQQLHQGYLAALIPNDLFATCGQIIAERDWRRGESSLRDFSVIDYWDDGSLLVLDLPGHSLGHLGFLLRTAEGPLLYAVDAFWDYEVYQRLGRLPWLGRRVQHDYSAYQQTWARLRALEQACQMPVLGCHCRRTQAYVDAHAN
jgi:glyoxylase-like metal-dependent hydrolase (beta-lactamase superfamily II)